MAYTVKYPLIITTDGDDVEDFANKYVLEVTEIYANANDLDSKKAPKVSPTTSGTLSHTGAATISSTLSVGGNVTISESSNPAVLSTAANTLYATFGATQKTVAFIDGAVANATNAVTASACSGNSVTATTATQANKLTTSRTISLSGAVTGSVSFDGTSNVNITTYPNGLRGQLFTTSGTFTVPTGVTEVYVTGCGGGGGGGNYSSGSGGGGGGSGRQCVKRKLTVTPGQAYTITIGAGGGTRAAGGATSFGALLTLSGGGGGGGGGAGEFHGGSGGTGESIGGNGQYSFYQMRGIGNIYNYGGGGGGQGLFELFDGTMKAANGTGDAGTGAYGYGAGGGGGGASNGVGGAGVAGVLLVEW